VAQQPAEFRPAEPPVPQGDASTWSRWTVRLDERLVLAAIDRAPETWRSAVDLSAATGIPLDRVQAVLRSGSAAVIVAPGAGEDGSDLYSTRAHYRETTSLVARYLEALDVS